MAHLNEEWEIVSSKKQVISNKVLAKVIKYKWKSFYYIWKLKSEGTRICYIEWKVLTEPDNTWMVHIEYLDRNIYINPNKERNNILAKLELLTLE